MIIQFGLELEERVYPENIDFPKEVDLFCGVNGLVSYLEKHLGISYPERHDYLRYEQYRQLLLAHIELYPNAFYAASLEADSMATAVALLKRRDELYINGWDFLLEDAMPTRLRTLAELESLVHQGIPTELYDGFAERFQKVLQLIPVTTIPLQAIYLNEPLNLLPSHVQKLLSVLQEVGVDLEVIEQESTEKKGDLQNFQNALLKKNYEKNKIYGDGSLIILKAKRETYLAEYLAKVFSLNTDFKPVCLIPDKNRALDNNLIEEGRPSFGILSASLARPTLQILKLASTFLWEPINPYKILEFVSLPSTPIHPVLARGIAKVMADKPGLFSGSWNAMVRSFFDDYDNKIKENPERQKVLEKEKEDAQEEYRFWFNRRRYDTTKAVPKSEVLEVYRHVARWANKQLDENKKKIDSYTKKIEFPNTIHEEAEQLKEKKENLLNNQPALESLRTQSNNVVQVLEALPGNDTHLSNLRLERLVKTINEPAAIRFRPEELGHLPYIHKSSAVVRSVDSLFWWNFVDVERDTGFARWYKEERHFLEERDLDLETPFEENSRILWQRMQAILKTRERLILVMPEYIEGKEQLAHPLWGDLNAALGDNLDQIIVDLDSQKNSSFLEQFYKLPDFISLETNVLEKPKPYFYIPTTSLIQQKDRESYSSLNSLLYYPYQWLFQHQIDFKKPSILSIKKDDRLLGIIAHSLFERLFNKMKDSNIQWTREEVELFIVESMPDLFKREGAVLLMYGFEPERIGLVNKIKESAWALVSIIQENNWKIVDTELLIEGKIAGQDIKGIADLVLQRGKEKAIVDLKWGGTSYRKGQFRNGEDLQLVIYSRLLDKHTEWAHTAYFIIKEGKMIARNTKAFEEAEAVVPNLDWREEHQAIWTKMEQTYLWRMEQIEAGKIEVRTEETYEELEEAMETGQFLDLLEMPKDNARYDDYRVLVGLVR